MKRTVTLLLTALLATATGVGMLWTGATLTSPAIVVPTVAGEDEGDITDLVRRFYAAVNEVVRTGEASALYGAVGPEFIVHGSEIGSAATLTGYGAYLATLRDVCQDCALDLESVLVQGDRAAVRVVARRQQGRTVLFNLPLLDGTPAWTAHEVLRIAGGRIAEIWSEMTVPVAAFPLFADLEIDLPSGSAILQAARFVVPPGARLSGLSGHGPQALLVEAGTLTVRPAATPVATNQSPGIINSDWISRAESVSVAGGREASRDETVLREGQSLVFAGETFHEARNTGESAAETLIVAIFPLVDGLPDDTNLTPEMVWRAVTGEGVSGRVLASAVLVSLPAGPAKLSAGRLRLEPGAGIGTHAVWTAEVLAVESGQLTLLADAKVRPTRASVLGAATGLGHAESPRGTSGIDVTLATGDAAGVQDGIVRSIAPAGDAPVSLLVVRIAPVTSDTRHFGNS